MPEVCHCVSLSGRIHICFLIECRRDMASFGDLSGIGMVDDVILSALIFRPARCTKGSESRKPHIVGEDPTIGFSEMAD